MSIDATPLLEALDVPEITVRRRPAGRLLVAAVNVGIGILNTLPGVKIPSLSPEKTYHGRLLSHREWIRLEPDLLAAANGELGVDNAQAVYEKYLHMIGIPPDVIFSLPTGVAVEAMQDFLACQRRAIRGSSSKRNLTPDSSSPNEDASPNDSKKTETSAGKLSARAFR